MRFQALRQEVAHPRTSVQLCLLGIVGGTLAALIIILFRLCVEWIRESGVATLTSWLVHDWLVLLLMPLISVAIILFIAFLTGFKHYRLGIPFVIHRVKYFYGNIPFRTTINQFFVQLNYGTTAGKTFPRG